MSAPFYYLVAEAGRRLLNPSSADKILKLGRICRLGPESRVLDMGCGKGEPACLLAAAHGCRVVGVDFEPTFIKAARARAIEVGVGKFCEFIESEGSRHALDPQAYDLVMALGTSFIYNGLEGTVKALAVALKPEGYMVVGEPYWKVESPPPEYLKREGVTVDTFASLTGTVARMKEWGFELVQFIRAGEDDWDGYEAHHWWAIDQWRRENPAHSEVKEVVRRMEFERESYLRWGEGLGWAIFVVRPAIPKERAEALPQVA